MIDSITEQEKQERQTWIDEKQLSFTARCDVCNGTGRMKYTFVKGFTTDVRCTVCDKRNDLALVADLYWKNVPPTYRFSTLRTLSPSDKSCISLERQQAVIDFLRANPDRGYSFFGPPRAGKTVWTTALYGRALWHHITTPYDGNFGKRRFLLPIWRITTKQMLDEHTAYGLGNWEDELDRRLNQPTVTAAKITHVRIQQRETPRLFLEEIDKVRETETRRNNLFEILDGLKSNEGQLVLNSNLTPEEFAEKFGADLWWRINEMTNVVSLF